ncbi:PAS domain S-box protein [Bradyrhizobium japonicum]|uniref:PAS domain-containing hybrid sensor histidine kinase/response regulator n=1 Tax=Bradyrhizobium japonicum TaxID=375 RepID=UPI001BA6595D|nr:PAS domain S-box protein [Bradyrhizobium japonicum]MBR0749034.1 PAS domain S-box protein [Bradyrhizobium japonicum]
MLVGSKAKIRMRNLTPSTEDPVANAASVTLGSRHEEQAFEVPARLFEELPFAVYLCDRDGLVLRYNRRAAELWGRSPKIRDPNERFCGSYRMFRPDGSLLPHHECPMADVLRTGVSVREQEVHIERPDGFRGIALLDIEVIKDNDGNIIGAVNCFQDITERKSGEEAALRLAAIVESSDDAIVSKDLDGTVRSWNGGAQRIFGYLAEEVIGKPITILIPPDRHNEEAVILERLRRGERIGSYETVRRRKDGSLVDISLTVSPLKDTEGRVIGASKIARNITQRLYAERALRESKARLQAAVDLVKLGHYAWNPQTNELQWDETLRAMWDLAAGAPVDYEVWRAGVHPDDLARVEAAIQRCTDPRGDGVYEIEYRVIGKTDGVERWIATRGQTNFENNVPVSFFGIALDVTNRKHIERELERRVEYRTRELAEANRELRSQMEKREIAEAKVQWLQRLDAVGQITSGVAHDFNNLLSVVLTNARLLSRTVQRPDEQEGIELIRTAADRGAKLIAQLLAFSGKQRLEPREVDLNSKLVGMVNLLSATLGGTVQLKTTFAPDLWPALIDPNQIEMIVLNLAINAKDAMQPGGTLTLETFNTVIESEPVRPEEPSPGDYVGLAVKDTGTGIPDHVLPLVFEPFFTTKEPGKGSGLGLAQVFGFAKQSGGGVRLETRLGQGTAVTIFLPRAWVDVSDDRADFVDATNRPQTMTGVRVLVVDDDKAVLKSTIRMLEVLGYATASAESANDALRLLARNQEINIVLADFAMPEMSGAELAKAICAMRPTLPVILMTGYGDLDPLKELKDSRIILKPFAEDDLVNTIEAALK